MGLAAAGDSISASTAGTTTTYGTYSGTDYSYGSIGSYSGTYNATTYNPAAAQAAQAAAQQRSNARFFQIAIKGRENLQGFKAIILKKQTVFPDSWHGGLRCTGLGCLV